jgi:hypothetical protein
VVPASNVADIAIWVQVPMDAAAPYLDAAIADESTLRSVGILNSDIGSAKHQSERVIVMNVYHLDSRSAATLLRRPR